MPESGSDIVAATRTQLVAERLRLTCFKLRTYAENFLNAVYSVEIPPTPLDKQGGFIYPEEKP